MTQILLPGFPEGAERINPMFSILRQDKLVTYFVGSDNYFSHAEDDAAGERFALSNLMANRHVRAAELERSARKYPHRTLMNWMAQYREQGPGSFYQAAPARKPRIMTAEKAAECAGLLAAGHTPAAVARFAGVGESTLRKAIVRKTLIAAAQPYRRRGGGRYRHRLHPRQRTYGGRHRLGAERDHPLRSRL